MPLTGRAKWLAFLGLIDPRVVKMVDSFGRVINQADVLGHNINSLSRFGRCYRSFWSGSLAAGATHYFAVLPAPGLKLIGLSRITTVEAGRLDATFLVGGTYGGTDYTAPGYNLDETLEDVAASTFVRLTGYTEPAGGAGERDSGAPIIASTTANRVGSVQTQVGADPAFDDVHIPVFRYTNPGTSAVDYHIDILFEEIPSQI